LTLLERRRRQRQYDDEAAAAAAASTTAAEAPEVLRPPREQQQQQQQQQQLTSSSMRCSSALARRTSFSVVPSMSMYSFFSPGGSGRPGGANVPRVVIATPAMSDTLSTVCFCVASQRAFCG
jgi:hypothetical protein